jgi:transposase
LKGRSLMKLFELRAEGLGYREISRVTGHSRNTVRRYLRDEAGKNEAARAPRRSKLDPFREVIDELVAQGLYSAPAIVERLIPLGYEGKETIVRDYVRKIRPPVSPRVHAVRRYETEPGQQLQFDWGIFPYIDPRGYERHIPGLAASLGYSRRSYLEFAHSADVYGLITALINTFYHFGGTVDAVLTDHMKTVVIGADGEGGWEYNSQIEDLFCFLGVSIKLCRVKRPETKGKVERQIRYVKENFWPGRSFVDLVDLNDQALAWCLERDLRLHPSLGCSPLEAFEKEKEHLSPLPDREELERFERRVRLVSLDSFVSFGGINYGVPFRYVGRSVTVLPRGRFLEIKDQAGEVIATHRLGFKTRSLVYLKDQYKGLNAKSAVIAPVARGYQREDFPVEVRSLDDYAGVVGLA